jgi:hypothetical protein
MSSKLVSNFELDIDKYNKGELEDIFDLPANYDHAFLELKATKLRDNVVNDGEIDPNVKKNTIGFINKAKDVLLRQLKNLSNFEKIADADIYNLDHDLKPSATTNVGQQHSIIEQHDTPYTQSLPSAFYKGVFNPLKKRIITKTLNIDTRFRNNYFTTQSTNFHLDLPIKFNNVVSLQLATFEYPTTAYVVSKQFGTNYFWVSATGTSGGTPERRCIVVPNGNYTAIDIVSFLNNYVTTNPNFTGTTYLKYLTFILNLGGLTFNSGSEQLVVSIAPFTTPDGNISTPTFNFSLDFQSDINGNTDYGTPLPLKLGWILGFREGYYENNSNYVSEGIVNTSGPSYMYLVVDDFNNNVNNSFYSAFNSSLLNKNILARISLQPSVFSTLTLTQNNLNLITNPREYFGPIHIQKLQVQLLDEYGRVIDLNNMDFSFCLNMQVIYEL